MLPQSLVKHKSKLEIAKEQARKAATGSDAVERQSTRPLPGYMRATAASAAMKKARPARCDAFPASAPHATLPATFVVSMECPSARPPRMYLAVRPRLAIFVEWGPAGGRRAAGSGLQGAPQPLGAREGRSAGCAQTGGQQPPDGCQGAACFLLHVVWHQACSRCRCSGGRSWHHRRHRARLGQPMQEHAQPVWPACRCTRARCSAPRRRLQRTR